MRPGDQVIARTGCSIATWSTAARGQRHHYLQPEQRPAVETGSILGEDENDGPMNDIPAIAETSDCDGRLGRKRPCER